ncbi:uncharacterized protein LOC117321499 [Pecten maximus]|uniref:uncharacterized protein LOC117321499 n=1 Tax=Pecten maximus TaxID=6579 RepID=UPI001458ED8C|nr:uncharacterized protein LOC117321499 [Pecten maximus]XP_033731808.1 uncharacterized protein LOC117321499 [Pecten maximus]
MDAPDSCPICWDDFKEPKLLKCCHSFCCKCLRNYTRKNRGRSELTCPLCRQAWDIPDKGVDGFLTNYFIADTHVKQEAVLLPCCYCRKERVLKTCSHCNQTMCSECAVDHREALRLSGEDHLSVFECKDDNTIDSDSDENDSTDSGRRQQRRNSSTMAIPFSLSIALPPIRTNFKVEPLSTFVIESDFPGSSERPFINCIYPVSEDECWIIPTAGPDLVRYTWEGERKQIIHLGGIITSLVFQPDGNFLISLWGDRSIVALLSDSMVRGFSYTGDIHPHSLAAFPDGRVVFCGPSAKPAEKSDPEKEKTTINEGSLSILTKDGSLIREVRHSRTVSIFENPAAVAVNPFNNSIAVADKGRGCVFLLSQHGEIFSQYKGANRRHHFPFLLAPQEDTQFLPLNLCYNREGNLYILDASSRLIHVLNPDGEFLGMIAPGDIEEFSHPFSIAVDHKGRIWIGDESDHCVRVFKISHYVNHFPRDN